MTQAGGGQAFLNPPPRKGKDAGSAARDT